MTRRASDGCVLSFGLTAFAVGAGIAGALGGCDHGSDEPPRTAAGPVASSPSSTTPPPGPSAPEATDRAGAPPLADAGEDVPRDAAYDANGPGEIGAACTFNSDCQLALRCSCDGGCVCRPGARGTGRNGLDACDSGDQCASSLCVEGPPDAGLFCSDACTRSADCTGALPTCAAVEPLGTICVRTPLR